MNLAWYIVLGCALLAILAAAAAFNRMVRLRNRVRRAWQDIDVQLELRHRLVPLLVQTVRGYARHESELLEEVTRRRAAAASASRVSERGELERSLSQAAGEVLFLAEKYPQLKADAAYADLSARLVALEDDLASSRKYYNGSVRAYNDFIQSFPQLLLARLLRFEAAEYFQLREGE